jgi:hypothetical protein
MRGGLALVLLTRLRRHQYSILVPVLVKFFVGVRPTGELVALHTTFAKNIVLGEKRSAGARLRQLAAVQGSLSHMHIGNNRCAFFRPVRHYT